MATHSSVLAWRIPGTGEPGGLSSLGSHRVGHDWSDLAAAAAAVMLLEKAIAPHSSTVARKIPWMEEPGRLQSVGLLRVRYDWATSLSLSTFMHWRRKWQPTPVFLPGESHGRRSLVGCSPWGRTAGHDWSDLAAAVMLFSGQNSLILIEFNLSVSSYMVSLLWVPFKKSLPTLRS